MEMVREIIASTKLNARPYQERIVSKVTAMYLGQYRDGTGNLEVNARSVLIESPTGSGKTSMGWLVAKVLQQHVPDLAVGWVAMRRNLLKQAAVENHSKSINVKDVHMISMFDHEPTELLELKRQGRKILIVADEAQHDACNSMAHLHNMIEPDYILGLSATPFRVDRVKLCFDKVIKDAGIHQLVQDGYLSKFDHYSIDSWTPESVAETYLREPSRWGKSIMYFNNLEKCHQCAVLLRGQGVAVEVVTGDSDVDEQIELFRKGHVQVLVNCMKLTEGFDCPDLQTAFVRDSVKGPTMQMAGRVFRLHQDLPYKQVVQSKNTKWPMIRTAMPVQQYLRQGDAWVSLTVNPKLNAINQAARLAISQTNVELPKMLLGKAKVRRLRF